MQHKTGNIEIHFEMIKQCVMNQIGFVASEHNGIYYIEFTGTY